MKSSLNSTVALCDARFMQPGADNIISVKQSSDYILFETNQMTNPVQVVASSIFGDMSNKMIPVVKAEEEEEQELVDPQTVLREECSQKSDAQNMWSKYQECNNRVNSRSNTTETCEEELIDYVQVLDKCVTKDLFKRLK